MALTTAEIMQIALDLGGFSEVPPDSGVWVEGNDIRRVLVGLDIGPAELKIAQDLGFDAVIAHHPVRRRDFWRVFARHRCQMREAGVPEAAIEAAIADRLAAIKLSEHNSNDDQVISVARLLDIPFLNAHLPLDEFGRQKLLATVSACQQVNPEATVEQVAAAIGELPSFRRSSIQPLVAHGSPRARAGRVVVSIAAGTNGGASVATAYFAHGVDTVIYMHTAPEDIANLKQAGCRGSLIITGHVPGDNIGLDALIQALRQRGLEVTSLGEHATGSPLYPENFVGRTAYLDA